MRCIAIVDGQVQTFWNESRTELRQILQFSNHNLYGTPWFGSAQGLNIFTLKEGVLTYRSGWGPFLSQNNPSDGRLTEEECPYTKKEG